MLFNTIFGGLFVILLGGLLYLAASGTGGDLVTWSNFWTYLLMGLGGLLFVRGLLDAVGMGTTAGSAASSAGWCSSSSARPASPSPSGDGPSICG